MIRSLSLISALVLLTPGAYAQSSTSDSDAARLEAAGGTATWSFVPIGRHERFGHAEMLVTAPLDLVRAQATDFAHYKDMSRGRVNRSHLVDRHAGTTDVYLQVPVLHGMVMLWEILRFSDVRRAPDGSESFTGTLVRGNVRAAEMSIHIKPAGNGRSIVECNLLVTPEFFAPQSMVDAELRDAAANIVHAFGERAQQEYARLTPPTPPATAVARTP